MVCILLWSSAVRVNASQAYRMMDVTRERISCTSSDHGGNQTCPNYGAKATKAKITKLNPNKAKITKLNPNKANRKEKRRKYRCFLSLTVNQYVHGIRQKASANSPFLEFALTRDVGGRERSLRLTQHLDHACLLGHGQCQRHAAVHVHLVRQPLVGRQVCRHDENGYSQRWKQFKFVPCLYICFSDDISRGSLYSSNKLIQVVILCRLLCLEGLYVVVSKSTPPPSPPPKGGPGCLMSPPCLESQGCHLIPLCYRLSCSSA